jgi:TPR repeat protein
MHIDGRGVPQNHTEAVRWLRLAADQGDAEAQSNLGNMYLKGTGIKQSVAEAMRWYRRAADQGLAVAQFNVGFGYVSGQGVLQDYVMAHMWFSLSAGQGSQDAATNRNTIQKMMTPAQIAEAQKLAREWKREPRRGPWFQSFV